MVINMNRHLAALLVALVEFNVIAALASLITYAAIR